MVALCTAAGITMPKKRGRPPKTPSYSSKQSPSPSTKHDSVPFDLTLFQHRLLNFEGFDDLSTKQASDLLKNLDVIKEKLKGKHGVDPDIDVVAETQMDQPKQIMDNIGAWNIRGANHPNKQKEISMFCKNNDIGLFGVLDNKLRSENFNEIKEKVAPGWNSFMEFGINYRGRIWLLWKPDLYKVQIINHDMQFIHCTVKEKRLDKMFELTLVYATNDAQTRTLLWNAIVGFNAGISRPWLVMGDFNAFIDPKEKLGGNQLDVNALAEFRNCVIQSQLVDMSYFGNHLTWDNKQLGVERVFCKLDRTLVNDAWIQEWPQAQTEVMQGGISDHCPMVVRWMLSEDRRKDA
ncbi:hypothetical protein RIF29_20290 [Crotalaria pallida]|uniref:Endonuclease/exonuclease/phosphatase domain-containing protein n=1 Tax=Crotalaria pallida TaxID=3830 RepID=A0AAN9F1B2_CROPI